MNERVATVFIIPAGFILTRCCIRSLLHHSGSNQIRQSCTVKSNTGGTVGAHAVATRISVPEHNSRVSTVTLWHIRQQGGCVKDLIGPAETPRKSEWATKVGAIVVWEMRNYGRIVRQCDAGAASHLHSIALLTFMIKQL